MCNDIICIAHTVHMTHFPRVYLTFLADIWQGWDTNIYVCVCVQKCIIKCLLGHLCGPMERLTIRGNLASYVDVWSMCLHLLFDAECPQEDTAWGSRVQSQEWPAQVCGSWGLQSIPAEAMAVVAGGVTRWGAGRGDKAASSCPRFLEEPPPKVLAAGTRGSWVTSISVRKPLGGPACDGLVHTSFWVCVLRSSFEN